MTFEEILNKELTPTERETLNRLKSDAAWKSLKDFVENHIIRWSYNILVDDMDPGEKLEDNLKAVRGFVQGWRTIKRIIEEK